MSTNEAMQLQQHVCVCVMVLGGERLERLDLKVKLQCHLRTTRWCCMLPPEYVLELRLILLGQGWGGVNYISIKCWTIFCSSLLLVHQHSYLHSDSSNLITFSFCFFLFCVVTY